MSRPTYSQSLVLRNVIAGRSLHHGFQGSAKSKSAISRSFDARTADIRACLDARWISDKGELTLQGEAALVRFDKGGSDE